MAIAVGDFNGDGYADTAVGTPGEDGAFVDSGAVNVIYGADAGPGSLNQIWTQTSMGDAIEAGDQFGAALTTGDFNLDGYDDLAISAPGEDVGGLRDVGAVSVIYGTSLGLRATGAQIFFQGRGGLADRSEEFDRFGSVLTGGDFDGDGYDDLAIGVPGENIGAINDAGAVHVLYGSRTNRLSIIGSQFRNQDAIGSGEYTERYDMFGSALDAGDFNGDGRDDLAVGVPGETVGSVTAAGIVQVLYGASVALGTAGNQIWELGTPGILGDRDRWDYFGSAVAAGDFNGDGRDDLAIGVPGDNYSGLADVGAVSVLFAAPVGTAGLAWPGNQQWRQGHNGLVDEIAAGDRFGAALATGDFNGDLRDDLAVGVPGEDVGLLGVDAGAVHMLYATHTLAADLDRLIHQDSSGIEDVAELNDAFGATLAAGNFNGDRRADLLVGAPSEDIGLLVDAGQVHYLFGTDAKAFNTATDRVLNQNSTGVLDTADLSDHFSGMPTVGPGGIPALHSNPAAAKTLYLDFDGHRVNNVGDRRDAVAPAFDLDGDVTTFNRSEQALMQDIWAHVAEDFAPFNINVTTVAPSGGPTRRAVIGGNWDDWYGKATSGVRDRDVADHIGWVFSEYIANGQIVGDLAARIGTTASHEIGHSFGLEHKSEFGSTGRRLDEYSDGTSEWTPIMGGNLSEDRTVWTPAVVTLSPDLIIRGDDDVAELTSDLGPRPDDHGNNIATATTIPFASQMMATGIVGTRTEFDFFRFTLPREGRLSIDLLVNDVGANLDGWLTFGHAASGSIIASVAPLGDLNASTTRTVGAGEYFVRVGAQRSIGSLGQYSLRVNFTETLEIDPAIPLNGFAAMAADADEELPSGTLDCAARGERIKAGALATVRDQFGAEGPGLAGDLDGNDRVDLRDLQSAMSIHGTGLVHPIGCIEIDEFGTIIDCTNPLPPVIACAFDAARSPNATAQVNAGDRIKAAALAAVYDQFGADGPGYAGDLDGNDRVDLADVRIGHSIFGSWLPGPIVVAKPADGEALDDCGSRSNPRSRHVFDVPYTSRESIQVSANAAGADRDTSVAFDDRNALLMVHRAADSVFDRLATSRSSRRPVEIA